jgi:hypothetical protein
MTKRVCKPKLLKFTRIMRGKNKKSDYLQDFLNFTVYWREFEDGGLKRIESN